MSGSDNNAWLDDDWTTWFLSSRPFVLSDVKDLYASAAPDVRQHISRGLINAIRSWEEDFHGLIVLHWLTRTTGALRVTGAIPSLIRILLIHRTRMQWTDPFFATADTILSVLASFAPDPDIERTFHALLFDETVGPHFAGLLALGISICNVERFPEAFNRFVEMQAKVPEYFSGQSVVAQFVNNLTLPMLVRSIGALSTAAHRYFVTNAVSAGVLEPSQLIGYDHDQRHLHQPTLLPLTGVDMRSLYESAGERYERAAEVTRKRSASILDELYTRMK